MKTLLRSFNQILEERVIPSRLLEEEDRLTFMLPELIPEAEIYGDIHQTYFYLNPVKYAGKILEYRRKQKRYKK